MKLETTMDDLLKDMKIDTTTTQDDVDDSPITPYREGFLDYMFGKFLWQNPYNSYGDIYDDDPDYYQWYDGWRDAQVKYPHLEPKETE